MSKKLVGIFVMTLLITTAILPLVSSFNNMKRSMENFLISNDKPKIYGETDIPDDCPYCMVSYWKMDEGSGSMTSDSYNGNDGGILHDNDGNDPAWCTGQVDKAICFAGDEEDMVSISDNPSLNFGTKDFSLEAWITYTGPKPSDNHVPTILSKRGDGSNGFFLALTYLNGNPNGNIICQIQGINYLPNMGGIVVDDGLYHHLVVTRQNTDLRFYIDGDLKDTKSSNKNMDSNHALLIGNDEPSPYGHTSAWTGEIDEVAVYYCSLSNSTIKCHYNNGLQGHDYCYCECDLDVETQSGFNMGTGNFQVTIKNVGSTDCRNVNWNITAEPIFGSGFCTKNGVISSISASGSEMITCSPNGNFGILKIYADAFVCGDTYSGTAYALIVGPYIFVF